MLEVILVLNVGSSSLKFAVFNADDVTLLCRGSVDNKASGCYLLVQDQNNNKLVEKNYPKQQQQNIVDQQQSALAILLEWLNAEGNAYPIKAVGHRVVHGGNLFHTPVKVTPEILQQLQQLTSLAPLHQPYNLAGILAFFASKPLLLQVACFDTAFHYTQPPIATTFALPRSFSEAGIKRYGFHGLSYEYIASVLPNYVKAPRVIVAHLGQGASLCAMCDLQSVATTMGFTALDGLMMGTRSGAIDPGVILHMVNELKLSINEVTDILYHRSGLQGVSQISNDMRVLLKSADPHAREAIDLFVYRIVREVGSLIAALNGIDAIVFTAGIGEHAASVRQQVCDGLSWLGIKLGRDANDANKPCISSPDSKVSVWVIPTNEELMIAQHVKKQML